MLENEFIDLLNICINDCLAKQSYSKDTNWEQIREISNKQDMEALIYYCVREKYSDLIDRNLIDNWKKASFYSVIFMNKFMKYTYRVFQLFQEKDIDFIALKGLYLRYLYPNPDLRTMSDIDILVHEEDLDRINEILITLGYENKGKGDHDVKYILNNRHCIEVHWTLDKESLKSKEGIYSKEVWNRTIEFSFFDITIKGLGYEDLLAYLCFHMASHMYRAGFGLRQLCDLVLLVNKKYDVIDWNIFLDKIKEGNLLKFTSVIFKLCNYLFNMKVVDELNNSIDISDEELDNLASYIINSGVYGSEQVTDKLGNGVIFNTRGASLINKVKSMISFIFIKPSQLDEKYNYAKKNAMLLPVAWTHRAILFIKKAKAQNKSIFSAIKSTKEKGDILNMLDL